MQQQGASGPIDNGVDSTYGGCEGDSSYAYQQFESPSQGQQREQIDGKLHPSKGDNKNWQILSAFAMALVMLLIFAVLCLLLVGGTGGWVSFCAACLAVFLITVVVVDKLK